MTQRDLVGRLNAHNARLSRDPGTGAVTLTEDPRHPLPADLRAEVERRLGDPSLSEYATDADG